jgi:hypothetical protein
MALGACNFQTVCASSNLKTDSESSRVGTYFECNMFDPSPVFYEMGALKRSRCIETCSYCFLKLTINLKLL